MMRHGRTRARCAGRDDSGPPRLQDTTNTVLPQASAYWRFPANQELGLAARPRRGRHEMRLKVVLALVTAVVVMGAGTAIASHVPEVDPATVPTGFLAAHNHVADVPVSAIARAAKPN